MVRERSRLDTTSLYCTLLYHHWYKDAVVGVRDRTAPATVCLPVPHSLVRAKKTPKIHKTKPSDLYLVQHGPFEFEKASILFFDEPQKEKEEW